MVAGGLGAACLVGVAKERGANRNVEDGGRSNAIMEEKRPACSAQYRQAQQGQCQKDCFRGQREGRDSHLFVLVRNLME